MGIPFIGIAVVLAITGLALLSMLLFGIRSFAFGKVSPISAVVVVLPVVILLVIGFSLGDWSQAAIYSILIMLGLAVLATLYTSITGLIGLR